jgi:hypothetical protein
MQAPRTFDLPCPWVPLQSVTAAASRESLNDGSGRCICGAKPPNNSNRSTAHPVLGAHTRRYVAEVRCRKETSSRRQRSRIARGERMPALSSTSAEASVQLGTLPRMRCCAGKNVGRNRGSTRHAIARDNAHATSSQRASPSPGPKPRRGASSSRGSWPKPTSPRRRIPLGCSRPKL